MTTQASRKKTNRDRDEYLVVDGVGIITRKMTAADWSWLREKHAKYHMLGWATSKNTINAYLNRQREKSKRT